MPIFRHTSATATPVSACFNANTICDSVNFDLFMAIMSSPASHNCPAFFYFIVALFLGRRSIVLRDDLKRWICWSLRRESLQFLQLGVAAIRRGFFRYVNE